MRISAHDRPKRKATPLGVKKEVVVRQEFLCACGCGQPVHWLPRHDTHFDHEPALRLRNIRADGRDYEPGQNDPRYIFALRTACHHAKTHGRGATTAGTDTGKIKKERKREKARAGIEKPKRKWPKRKMRSSNRWRT